MTAVSIVHDYLTQRGGAERVVLGLAAAFAGAPIYTSLFDPPGTFSEFGALQVIGSPLNRVAALRRSHRLALPLLPWVFSHLRVPGEVVVCSSSGWAHGASTEGRKVVYCHSPAKWLYQPDRYLHGDRRATRALLGLLRPDLLRWDQRAARGADRYIANSTAVQRWVRDAYGIEAAVVPPAYSLDPAGPQSPPAADPGYLLCVSRLLFYKNVDAVLAAMTELPDQRLVVVGSGPDEAALRAGAPANVDFLGAVDDSRLRGLYRDSIGVVCASYEDFGLVPIEAAAFGKPAAALRWGGFLDTVVEAETGVFFDSPTPTSVATALRALVAGPWSERTITAHAATYAPEVFAERIRAVVAEVASQ